MDGSDDEERSVSLIRQMLANLLLEQVCKRCRHPNVAHCNYHAPVWECSECDCRGFEKESSESDVFAPVIAKAQAFLEGR